MTTDLVSAAVQETAAAAERDETRFQAAPKQALLFVAATNDIKRHWTMAGLLECTNADA